MPKINVMTALLEDLSKEQPISSVLSLGQDFSAVAPELTWDYFNVSDFLNLAFQKRYDLAIVQLAASELQQLASAQQMQILVKLRDLMAKRIIVIASAEDEKQLRALGFSQISDHLQQAQTVLWQFNILTYKHVPDWLNAKYWANPEHWDKFRW